MPPPRSKREEGQANTATKSKWPRKIPTTFACYRRGQYCCVMLTSRCLFRKRKWPTINQRRPLASPSRLDAHGRPCHRRLPQRLFRRVAQCQERCSNGIYSEQLARHRRPLSTIDGSNNRAPTNPHTIRSTHLSLHTIPPLPQAHF